MKIRYAANLRRRGSVVLASLAAVVGLSVVIPPTTTASSATSSGNNKVSNPAATTNGQKTGADSQITLDGVSASTHVITLITGDRVTLSGIGDGHFTVDVQPATRPDDEQPTFDVESGPDAAYVIPSDAKAAVAAGRLDGELFDVKYLAEHGYTNGQTQRLPVIAQYRANREPVKVNNSAEALPASTLTRGLASIHSAAVSVTKSNATAFWASIDPGPAGGPASTAMTEPSGLDRGLTGLWLDAKVHATLDESVPLIGAPQAWAAGFDGSGVKVAVLDTGIDQTHPDLQGKVAESQSFVPGVDSVKDGNGHGTHVASTIAGTGAAEGGKYKGVAHGAQLVVGKVLADNGTGNSSWIIAGMQWAAHSGAKVVSMSLGGGPTDGTDPLSQAVNDLTAQTGTLFVIAAGNAGPGESTIAAPGTADAALTVAATDKSDQLAGFSSRGPRAGDGALKPDIAAPGVHIVAARAAGTSLCANATCGDPADGPVDDFYSQLSGTSMATPHVAGAAAILAEEYPDWTAPQLKAALMSTAKDDGFTVYQQGAGRVDVARAFTQKVYATTPNVDFGRISSTQGSGPVDKQVGYTNLTDHPVTLALAPQLHTTAGDPAPDGALTVDATTLTVPAGGTATATATLDPTSLAKDEYTGAITATADGIQLTTPVGLSNLANLTIHIVNDRPSGGFVDLLPVEFANGQADTSAVSSVAATQTSTAVRSTAAGDQPDAADPFEATVSFSVPPGTYSATALITWTDADLVKNIAAAPDPQISVTDDTDVTLDLREAKQITFTTPRPSQRVVEGLSFERTGADGNMYITARIGSSFNDDHRLWALPTERVSTGIFRYATQATLVNPQVTMTVDQPEHRRLPVLTRAYGDRGHEFVSGLDFGAEDDPRWVPWTKDQTVQLVDAGFGDPEDIDGLDLHGKLALLRYNEFVDLPGGGKLNQCHPFIDRVENVRQAGAVGVVFFPINPDAPNCQVPSFPTDITEPQSGMNLPEAWLTPSEGQHLADQAAKDTVRIDVDADPNVRYSYDLKEYEEQQIPNSLNYTYTSRDLAQFDTAFHASDLPAGGRMWGNSAWHAFKPGTAGSFVTGFAYAVQQTRPVYVGPLSSNTVWRGDSDIQSVTAEGKFVGALRTDRGPLQVLDQPIRTSEQRQIFPIAPGVMSVAAAHAAQPDSIWKTCAELCREGDTLWANYTLLSGGNETSLSRSATRHLVRADGEEIPLTGQGPFGIQGFTLPEQPGTYRLVDDTAYDDGSRTNTTWTFTSPGTPNQTRVQPGTACFGILWGSTDACQPEPVVFLNYDLGNSLGLDNTVAAPGHSTIQIHAYHNPAAALQMPSIAGLKLWASTDDGAHWKQLQVTQQTKGSDVTFNATVAYPKFAATTGAVSLKAEAWDTAGNRIEQTLTHAYNLRTAP